MLRIISDEWAELKDGSPVMAVRAAHNMGCRHGGEKRAQDLREALMIQLLDE